MSEEEYRLEERQEEKLAREEKQYKYLREREEQDLGPLPILNIYTCYVKDVEGDGFRVEYGPPDTTYLICISYLKDLSYRVGMCVLRTDGYFYPRRGLEQGDRVQIDEIVCSDIDEKITLLKKRIQELANAFKRIQEDVLDSWTKRPSKPCSE
jgi:hypothetical protein